MRSGRTDPPRAKVKGGVDLTNIFTCESLPTFPTAALTVGLNGRYCLSALRKFKWASPARVRMDYDTLTNFVKNLSKSKFDATVLLLMEKVFLLTPLDVDRKGDGGTDLRAFHDSGGATTAVFQKTVQDRMWKQKALDDATRAVHELTQLDISS